MLTILGFCLRSNENKAKLGNHKLSKVFYEVQLLFL